MKPDEGGVVDRRVMHLGVGLQSLGGPRTKGCLKAWAACNALAYDSMLFLHGR